MKIKQQNDPDNIKSAAVITKKTYSTPALQVYGKLNYLTQGSGGNGDDGALNMNMMSDRRTKENIIKIGTSDLGISLYLFDYKSQFRDGAKRNRQFGVMADEVEVVMPRAVSVGLDGYKRVNYGMLGIQLNH